MFLTLFNAFEMHYPLFLQILAALVVFVAPAAITADIVNCIRYCKGYAVVRRRWINLVLVAVAIMVIVLLLYGAARHCMLCEEPTHQAIGEWLWKH